MNWTGVSCTADGFFTSWPPAKLKGSLAEDGVRKGILPVTSHFPDCYHTSVLHNHRGREMGLPLPVGSAITYFLVLGKDSPSLRFRDTCWLPELMVRGLRSETKVMGCVCAACGMSWCLAFKSWEKQLRDRLKSVLAPGSWTWDPRPNLEFAAYQPYDLRQMS